MSFLELTAVSKYFGPVAAVDGVSLEIPAGSRTAIVGPSGSGKTTLLRLIAGFEAPDAGSIQIGEDVLAGGSRFIPAYRRGIGIVSQDGALFPHLTIAENIGFGLERTDPRRIDQIIELIDMVGLDRDMLPRKPDQLSGGQQQRVALARALARKPRLMLLDEPFSALDTGLRVSTRKAVADLLGKAGITTILVTHDQVEALSFADQVAVLHEGRLQQAGPPRELYFRPNNRVVAELLGDAIILDAAIADGRAECVLGRLAVDDAAFNGAGQVMLRPDHLALAPVTADIAVDPPRARAEIIDVDFCGGGFLVMIRLLRPSGSDEPISGNAKDLVLAFRTSDIDVPEKGSIVELAVRGIAHVFPSV